jgi:endonuclease/exonuclease/phosphatase family metal-dependent hydrolase
MNLALRQIKDTLFFSVLSYARLLGKRRNLVMAKHKPTSKPLRVATTDLKTQQQKREQAIKLLQSWREDDEEEQKETWEYLKQALDEDRLSDRKLFS